MRLLDLFCGAGGAGMGYHRAGFEVVGVDIKPQKHYPFEFHQADAFDFFRKCMQNGFLASIDAIHASPPCQAYSALRHLHNKPYPDLIGEVRDWLILIGKPYVIENVPGAPLEHPVLRCGSAYSLRVRRHRLFESSFTLQPGACFHNLQGRPIDVSGTGGRRINRRRDDHGGNTNKPRNIAEARRSMGIDWMNRYELSQAIPPAFTEQIGKRLLEALNAK
jgi:DNA (cytosine-5)-methyltransferase 1